jgi:hypothetical protein
VELRTVDTAFSSHTLNVNGQQTGASQDDDHLIVADNLFSNVNSVWPIRLMGEPTGRIRRAAVTGNTINGANSNASIRLVHAHETAVTGNVIESAGSTAISLQNAVHTSVTANRVANASGSGIAATDCTEVAIVGNGVRGVSNNGLHILNGSRFTVADNRVDVAGGYGIQVSSGAADVRITGNRFRSTTQNGLNITNTVTGVVRYGNDARNTPGISDSSSGAVTSAGDQS